MKQLRTGDLLKSRFNTHTFNRDGFKLIKNKYYKIKDISVRSTGEVFFHIYVEKNYVDEYDLDGLRKMFVLDDEFDTTEIGGPKQIIVPTSSVPKITPNIDYLADKIPIHSDIINNINSELEQINDFLKAIRDEINPNW